MQEQQPINKIQESIIGCLILFPEELDSLSVDTNDFTGDYKLAFESITKNNGGDPITISNDTAISPSKIGEWVSGEFSAVNLHKYCEQLKENTVKRRASKFASQVMQAKSSEEIFKLVDLFQSNVNIKEKTEPRHISKGMRSLSKYMEERYEAKGQLLGMTTGIYDLDQKTEGLHRGDLVVIAGPSSMGKTAFGINVIEGAAKAGQSAMIFSCEMTEVQLMMRIASSQSNVSFNKIRASHKLGEVDWPKLTRGFETTYDWDVHVDDASGITVTEICRKTRKLHSKNPLDILLVDYLQILSYNKDRENIALDEITATLKQLAKELNICVILISQLNRSSEREQRKPRMTDLRGSGAIENHSDVILFPWRPAANCQQCQEGVNNLDHDLAKHQSMAEIIVAKQRQGERNVSIPVLWVGDRVKFENLMR
jgi:replicative DNA helicase